MNPRIRTFAAIVLIALPALTKASSAADRDSAWIGSEKLIRSHLEPSTATFQQSSYNFPGSHLRNDTAAYSVEASIAPAFTLFHGHIGHGDGLLPGTFLLDVVPQFVVRRSDGIPSNPVRTPSYAPAATLYYAPRDSFPENNARYFSITLRHYSNGQAGPFLRPDGGINDVDGSFSLWSMAAGLHVVHDWPLLPAYQSLEVSWYYNKEGLLEELYPDVSFSLKLQTREQRHAGWGGWGGRSRVLIDLDWLVQNPSDRPASMKPSPFAGAVTGVFTPERTGSRPGINPGFSVFARYYAGYDSYNMNFSREIYRIDAGLMFGPY